MVMATLHGTTIEITMPDDHKETFELARVGTLKEFETVKEALVNAQDDRALATASLETAKGQRAQMSELLDAANEAHKAEKETSADLNGKLNADRARLTELQAELATVKAEHQDACQELGHRIHVENALRQAEATLATRAQQREAKDAELENLMHAKSSLEETNTALEVSQKELCEAKAERDALAVCLKESNDALREAGYPTECPESGPDGDEGVSPADRIRGMVADIDLLKSDNATLTDLKAELLKHAGCMSDVLDAMHAKLTGE